ncbi:hypothetical protein [Jiangella muralis]|uniref:hypothetical protein n=1 Tax=Jiangella muralis TaxID=702383 RepID=UPI00069E18A8|nr:hypothetical protein [Jiangella muralis]
MSDSVTTLLHAIDTLDWAAVEANWMVAGWYDIRVSDGRIAAITLRPTYEEGDRALTEAATARCAAGTGGRVAA